MKCILIYSFTKGVPEDGSANFVKLAKNISMTRFIVRDVTVFRVATF